MADSGVDTSNESCDSIVLEFDPPAIPLTRTGEPFEWFDPANSHDHIGKVKLSYLRNSRLKTRYAGIINSSRNKKLRFAASTNNVELVEQLLGSGADPNTSDEHKRSPLHFAACRGFKDIVRALVRHGANPNSKDALGNTPLHLAACTSNIPVVTELLAAGTDVTSNDKNGRNPIQLAQSKLKLIQQRPATVGHANETDTLKKEICMVVEMMLKYLEVQRADAADIEAVRERLARVSTRAEVDTEVQCLLNSLDGLKLR